MVTARSTPQRPMPPPPDHMLSSRYRLTLPSSLQLHTYTQVSSIGPYTQYRSCTQYPLTQVPFNHGQVFCSFIQSYLCMFRTCSLARCMFRSCSLARCMSQTCSLARCMFTQVFVSTAPRCTMFASCQFISQIHIATIVHQLDICYLPLSPPEPVFAGHCVCHGANPFSLTYQVLSSCQPPATSLAKYVQHAHHQNSS